MAISPLALGIGLQGKYDYKQQAALEMSRQRGRAKAEAAEEAGKEKKRAEIRKMIVNIRPQGLLPVHEKEINDGVADLLNYAMDNPEDFAGVTQGVHKLESRSLAAKEQSKLINSLSRQSYFEGDKDALQIVMSTNDPAVLEENLSMLPTNIKYDKATSNLAVLNSKYKNTPTRIDEILSKGGDRYAQLTGEEEVIDVNGKKFIQRKFKPEVIDVALNDMLIGDNLQSSNDDYYTELKRQKIALPNLRTDEGRKEFADGRDAFLRKQITDDLSRRELLLNVTPGKDRNIYINNAPPLTPGEIGAPSQVGVRVVYSGGQRSDVDFSSTSLGFLPRLDDFTMTLPTSVGTFYAGTGDQVPNSGSITATYNGADAHYVANKDVKIPSHWQGYPNGGGSKFIPEKNIKKGQLVDDSEVETLKKQKALDIKFVVFGKTDTNQSIYRTYDEAGIVPILQRSTSDKKLVNEAIKNANTKYRDAKAKLYGTSAPAQTPAPKIDIPKPKGDVKKDKPAPTGQEMKSKGVPESKRSLFDKLKEEPTTTKK